MDLIDVSAALLSAVLHAGWNAAVKGSRNPTQVMTAQMLIGALLVVPALFWSGLPSLASFGWTRGMTAPQVRWRWPRQRRKNEEKRGSG